ncbi:unnamed protein product [Staurois parvus]|uniref:Uncharacterized protein n=1 Tax=Staurois parvus TaxID=386267 RepID=A0ABN9BBX0_9NEOB|nr:unnamed protein product [Staurois parvus]
MFDPLFSDPPILPMSPIYLLIEQRLRGKLHMLSLVFFFLGRVHVISTGQSALSRQRSHVLHPSRAERKLLLQALASTGLETDRSHKTALTADEKRYLAV